MLDGDSNEEEDKPNGVIKLPGNAPEIEVFGKVLEGWDELNIGGRLTVALNQMPEKQDWVKARLEKVQIDVGDHHLLFVRAAEALSFLPTATVEQAFCNLYAQTFHEQCSEIADSIRNGLEASIQRD